MNKAFSLIEILVSVIVMSIISLCMANFSSSVFNISYESSASINTTNQLRQLSVFLANEINRASYIFPCNIQLSLNTNSAAIVVDTENAIAFLVDEDISNSSKKYFLKVFYIKDNNVYFFTSINAVSWPSNTLPSSYFSSSTGNTGLVLSNIGTSTLSYIMNPSNGSVDVILKGTIGGASSSSSNALIRGVDWIISVQDKDYHFGGLSQNVPR